MRSPPSCTSKPPQWVWGAGNSSSPQQGNSSPKPRGSQRRPSLEQGGSLGAGRDSQEMKASLQDTPEQAPC